VRKPEDERPPGRSRSRWADNIKIDLEEIGWGDLDWIYLVQDRDQRRALVKKIMNITIIILNINNHHVFHYKKNTFRRFDSVCFQTKPT
jgi:hypothetical protein